ncbi:hypothetical protein CUJ83_08655 [Methanocella sp. CWC-04]|uniref:ChrB N-terminal domain-containing protein n=2 Tax=Methanooceanicella nereidis TaxID=2052831 RepID=A0AAP2RCL1_9EURY|nr:hypothetical protein [Methanocella sp. CWC-04]
MRAKGAVSLQNGAWALPDSPKNGQFAKDTASFIRSEGGNAFVFIVTSAEDDENRSITDMFRNNIDEEYIELISRCRDLRSELEKETRQKKFTFAELDENEEDLQKLTGWLRKIRSRDFFKGLKADDADKELERCRKDLEAFEQEVYRAEGLDNV